MNSRHLAVRPCFSSLVVYLKRRIERQHVEQLSEQPAALITISAAIISVGVTEGREAGPNDGVRVIQDRVEEPTCQQL